MNVYTIKARIINCDNKLDKTSVEVEEVAFNLMQAFGKAEKNLQAKYPNHSIELSF
jgi:hypothetical protein